MAGWELWRGPSPVDGTPIMLLATWGDPRHANAKTGRMLQTYILRQDVPPAQARREGLDNAICGGCPQRPSLEGACYVREDSMASVYRGWRNGGYPAVAPADIRRQRGANPRDTRQDWRVRVGTYGDPTMVPMAVWEALLSVADGRTGYTHMWGRKGMGAFRHLLMASCETEGAARMAQRAGWRTFRVLKPDAAPDAEGLREILCPASEEAGKRTTCRKCGLCDGSRGGSDRRKSVAIHAHGPRVRK